LAAYVLAGTACTDILEQRSFLLFAIALESVVLGKSIKTEIGFQLSIHVANLLGDGIDGKRIVKKDVNKLYAIRSGVAHAGKSEVPAEEVGRMRQLCLRALLVLTVSPAFATMTKSAELDDWFTDRLLDSPSHLANLDSQPGPRQDTNDDEDNRD
jgi:hypothetical protein